jgi:cystathionine beta-lyase/cystathionine gamma-synthase
MVYDIYKRNESFRVSLGLEDPEELISDIDQPLESIYKE